MIRERAAVRAQRLLERDGELAEIDACIVGTGAGEGSFLVLEGHAGMGKSALLAEVCRRASGAGLATCSASGSELEADFAFGVVRQLFEPTIGHLAARDRDRAFEGAGALAEPVLDLGGEVDGRSQFAALHGLYWLAANLSGRTPLLLSVDDAHWADAASLRWLAYLLNRLEGLPILVAVATRAPQSGPQGDILATILANRHVRVRSVGPLGEPSVAALIRSALGSEPDPIFTAACLRATTGNPLGLNELLRELRVSGVGPSSEAAADLERRAPDAIARRVLRDLSLLGSEAERLAMALAVLGDGAELRLIAWLADLDVGRAAEAADELEAADLISSERPPRFVHPLLRAAVYDGLPAGVAQKLHRQAAEILAADGEEPEAVAAHLLRCEAGQSVDTVDLLRAAAPLALRRGAPETAVSYLRRALAEDLPAGLRAAVLADLGRAEQAAGNAAASGHLREALTATTDRRDRAVILTDLALAVFLQGDESACRDLLVEALDEVRGYDPDTSTRLECLATSMVVTGLGSADPRVASSVDSHFPRLREVARDGTPNAELARATMAFVVSWRDGDRKEALSLLGNGFDWKGLFDGSPLHCIPVTDSMMALLGIDELHRAAGWCETVIREAAAAGYVLTVVTGMLCQVNAESRMGLLAEAEADATAALELSQQHSPYWARVIGSYLADILFERGRQQDAYEAIERIGIDPGLGGMVEATVRLVRGRLRCARGWRRQGLEDLRASGRLCERLRLRNPIIWPWRASLARALAADRPEEARQLALDDLANARRSGIPRGIARAMGTLARLDHDDAVDLLRAGVEVLEQAPAPLDQARALANLGGVLRREGHRVEAREPLREALEIAARCGAVPLMERVQAELLAAGGRPRRPRLRGVDALTPSELRVARLAADGCSNREVAQALFITAKTVADHLSSTYSKLDITSREHLSGALGLSDT